MSAGPVTGAARGFSHADGIDTAQLRKHARSTLAPSDLRRSAPADCEEGREEGCVAGVNHRVTPCCSFAATCFFESYLPCACREISTGMSLKHFASAYALRMLLRVAWSSG